METIWLLGQILIINLVLSGDNALVIAMASKDLPEQQRKKAVWIGTVGAVLLRCVLTFIAVLLLKIPYLQAGGALLLLWIAFKLLADQQENHIRISESLSIWSAINTILIADFVMSLDNVLAIAGIADGDLALIMIGIVLSIPIVVWGSGIISKLLQKFPFLLYIGSGILAYTAGEMILQDAKAGFILAYWMPEYHSLLPVILALLVIGLGGLKTLHIRRA
ncbi:TerC family protein [Paenibacillus dakarensis]|uniref:TerC family protein n=1 Tax=Paenibacillus dakarensis TaxID=1527293 RepID=UPI0006D547D0|nr:TerC family protein [Paenibacillus dakarensis]